MRASGPGWCGSCSTRRASWPSCSSRPVNRPASRSPSSCSCWRAPRRVVAGLFIGTQSAAGGATSTSRIGVWSGALVLELLSAVPFLCALPPLFHQLVNSTLLHAAAPGSVDMSLGASELLPMVAILPYLLYQLAGFGTLSYVVSKMRELDASISAIFAVVIAELRSRIARATSSSSASSSALLCLAMAATVFYGDPQAARHCRPPTTRTCRRPRRRRRRRTRTRRRTRKGTSTRIRTTRRTRADRSGGRRRSRRRPLSLPVQRRRQDQLHASTGPTRS